MPQETKENRQIFAINVNTIITGLGAGLIGLLCHMGNSALGELKTNTKEVLQLRAEVLVMQFDIQQINTKLNTKN